MSKRDQASMNFGTGRNDRFFFSVCQMRGSSKICECKGKQYLTKKQSNIAFFL